MKTAYEILKLHSPCTKGARWLGKERTLTDLYNDCGRADWLLWAYARLNPDPKLIVLAACAYARTALQYLPHDELRPRRAVETAEAWCRGEATLEQVEEATEAAAVWATEEAAEEAAAWEAVASVAKAAAAVEEAAEEAAAWAARAAAAANQNETQEQADTVRAIISLDAFLKDVDQS